MNISFLEKRKRKEKKRKLCLSVVVQFTAKIIWNLSAAAPVLSMETWYALPSKEQLASS